MSELSSKELSGKRIAVSRSREETAPLVELLHPFGASVWAVPLIRIEPPRDPAFLNRVANELDRYDWVVITSAHAARALAQVRGTAPWPDRVQVAAVGEGTSRTLAELGVRVAMIPDEPSGAGLAAALSAHAQGGVAGCRVLFPRSNRAGRALLEDLRAAGAAVEEVEAYTTHLDHERANELLAAIRDHQVDAVVLTSPSNAESLFGAATRGPWPMSMLASVRVISIGPTTSAKLVDLGRPPDAEAARPDAPGILEAIRAALR